MDQSEVLFTNRLVNFNVELVNFETNFANFGTKFGHFGKSFVKPTVINLQFRPSGWRLQFILWRSVTDNIMKVVDIISKPILKCQNSQYKYEMFQIISSRQTLYQSHGQFISKHL